MLCQRARSFSSKKSFQKVSGRSQTRAVVPENVSKAQLPTPPGLRERSNQRLTFFLEGHGRLINGTKNNAPIFADHFRKNFGRKKFDFFFELEKNIFVFGVEIFWGV